MVEEQKMRKQEEKGHFTSGLLVGPTVNCYYRIHGMFILSNGRDRHYR